MGGESWSWDGATVPTLLKAEEVQILLRLLLFDPAAGWGGLQADCCSLWAGWVRASTVTGGATAAARGTAGGWRSLGEEAKVQRTVSSCRSGGGGRWEVVRSGSRPKAGDLVLLMRRCCSVFEGTPAIRKTCRQLCPLPRSKRWA